MLVWDRVEGTISGRSGTQLGSIEKVPGGMDVHDRAAELAWSIRRRGRFWQSWVVLLAPDGTELGEIRSHELIIEGRYVGYYEQTHAAKRKAKFGIYAEDVRLGEVVCETSKVPGRWFARDRERTQVRFHKPVSGGLRYLVATVPYLCVGASTPAD